MKPKRKNSAIFDAYLMDDENILWMDQPSSRKLLSPNDIFLIPFSLMWGGFAIFWTLSAASSGAPFFFVLWGVPFVVVGQYFIWGRFVYKYFRREQTFYAITSRRVLILSTLFNRSLTTYQLHQVTALNWQGNNLLFDKRNPLVYSNRNNFALWNGETLPGFYGLNDVETPYRILQNLLGEQDDGAPRKSKRAS
ncbi:hypothetical protein G4Y79_10015 [Phototrophicus methaneseepsis]|uniref:PH domain-containing protein n=1 Tax=Phototrophicus methaneseepsis TaxID=2710758 RepID=A0A7S8IH03_9CHLR|nr:hypothetical protein [Phototrophicus methaneseepsis]QPC84688.1 hypothetical protein G4Y79_10015 [Phototrophicus methaneseepsis]